MNHYFVHYYENGTKKKASNFKSLKDAIEFKNQKEKESGYTSAYVDFEEIIPDDLKPYPDTRLCKEEFSAGNVVIFENKLAIISGSYLTLSGDNTYNQCLDDYILLFLSGDASSWVKKDQLDFFAVGDSYLVNAWHKKYILFDDTICLVDIIKTIGR